MAPLKKVVIAKATPVSPSAKLAAKPKNYKPLEKVRVDAILDKLHKAYPKVVCALHHDSAWQLVVATILSAQCTDVRVNLVTPALFRRYPTPQSLAKADPAEVEDMIRTTGFFRNKTKSILGAAKKVSEDFGGKIPDTMDELLKLPGVARKTANVVLGSWFRKNEGVVVDTHVYRLSHRLDMAEGTNPGTVEQELMKIVPRNHWTAFSHELIHHGRQICIARKPRCADCTLETLCHAADKTWSTVWQHKPLSRVEKELA
jgi:endonuclease-3